MNAVEVDCSAHGRTVSRRGSCYRCEIERNRRRSASRDAVRKPPRPPFERIPGRCAMCGEPPAGRRRSWCSDDCVRLWWCATSSRTALDLLLDVHGDRCWDCDAAYRPGARHPWDSLEPDGGWPDARYCVRPIYGPPLPRPVELFVDHVRPLWKLTDAERLELRWWLPFNLQLLCGTCHAAKTASEASERAALRRSNPPAPADPDPVLGRTR